METAIRESITTDPAVVPPTFVTIPPVPVLCPCPPFGLDVFTPVKDIAEALCSADPEKFTEIVLLPWGGLAK